MDKKDYERIAPASGYVSKAKEDYRFSIWSAIVKRVDLYHIPDEAVFVCMPSTEGREIEVMVSLGIPEKHILAIDDNPALIASAKWRKTFPNVRCYGIKISKAPERMEKDGLVVLAANLDMCSNLNDKFLGEVNSFLDCIRYDCFCFAVNMMKGRETSALNLLLRKYGQESNAIKCSRMNAFAALCPFLVDKSSIVLDQGSYVGSRVPMSWAIFTHEISDPVVVADVKECLRLSRRMESINNAYYNTYNNAIDNVPARTYFIDKKFKRMRDKIRRMDYQRFGHNVEFKPYRNDIVHSIYDYWRAMFNDEIKRQSPGNLPVSVHS